ncbi:SNF2 domain-containing protein CLASSY 2 [Clarias magur]|uniref:SNF2 domain-containing protein CLASSY 2 n=1 Tax=Clarias magur TaxID=1594786 RepID=A0A8J4TEP2_CLAMG|nr:SNF2 domain-containing protein CLASSY 2 [Clarias magur]
MRMMKLGSGSVHSSGVRFSSCPRRVLLTGFSSPGSPRVLTGFSSPGSPRRILLAGFSSRLHVLSEKASVRCGGAHVGRAGPYH